MKREQIGKHRAVVSGGLTTVLATRLSEACGEFSRHDLLRHVDGAEDLLNAVAAAGHSRPVTVVIASTWLRDEGLELLTEVRQVSGGAITLAVGRDFGSLALGHALRLGLRGLTDRGATAAQLARILQALAAGDIWISRRQLVDAVQLMAPDEDGIPSEIWLNLPMLTERERGVLMEVLDGKPNKVIARQLDISEQTVKIHVMHVFRKLGVRRRVDLLKALSDGRPAAPGLAAAAAG